VLGFLPSLDNRAVAQILLQSITTESRQQLQFRQLLGLPSMVESFETGLVSGFSVSLRLGLVLTPRATAANVGLDAALGVHRELPGQQCARAVGHLPAAAHRQRPQPDGAHQRARHLHQRHGALGAGPQHRAELG
jgi:hypothetical protein